MSAEAVDIPRRSWFKPAEVCQIAGLQPYVLRSWEVEFPDLGVAGPKGGPRVYRRSDVERVLRIKQLVFVEGLTLAGARRKLEEEAVARGEVASEPLVAFDAPPGDEVRERLAAVKAGLQSLLQLLSGDGPRRPSAVRAASADEAAVASAGGDCWRAAGGAAAAVTGSRGGARGTRGAKAFAAERRKRARRAVARPARRRAG